MDLRPAGSCLTLAVARKGVGEIGQVGAAAAGRPFRRRAADGDQANLTALKQLLEAQPPTGPAKP